MKYNKISIIIFTLFLLINIVHAEKVLLFDEWIEPEKSIRLGDYKIKPLYADDKVLFKSDEFSVAVDKGTCRTESPFQLCYNKTRLLVDGKVVPDNINSNDVDTELEIHIYGIVGELEITREFESTLILQNEEIDVTVVIENIGDADAKNVEYEEKYPDSFQIINVKNCFIEDEDTIVWNGLLRKEKTHKCTYSLIGLEEKIFTSKATVKYHNGIDDETFSDSQKLTIPEPYLEVEYDTNKTKLKPGDTISALITVINNYESNIDIENLHVIIPPEFTLIKRDILSEENNWNGIVGETWNTTLEFQAIKTGIPIIQTSVDYSIDGNMLNVIKEKKIKVENDLTIEIIENIEDMAYNQSNPILIKVSNPNNKIINDVRTQISSNLLDFENVITNKDNIGRNNNYIVFNKDIIPQEMGDFYFNITVEYKNEFNEKFNYSIGKIFTVTNTIKNTNINKKQELASNQENNSENINNPTTTKKILPTLDFSGKSNKSKGLLVLAIVFTIGFIFFIIRFITRSY
jgi:hypothetical protein